MFIRRLERRQGKQYKRTCFFRRSSAIPIHQLRLSLRWPNSVYYLFGFALWARTGMISQLEAQPCRTSWDMLISSRSFPKRLLLWSHFRVSTAQPTTDFVIFRDTYIEQATKGSSDTVKLTSPSIEQYSMYARCHRPTTKLLRAE